MKSKVFILFTFIVCSLMSYSQETLTIDLSSPTDLPIQPCKISAINVKGGVPGIIYKLKVEIENVDVTALDYKPEAYDPTKGGKAAECPDFDSVFNQLKEFLAKPAADKTEAKYAEYIRGLNKLLDGGKCKMPEVINKAQDIVNEVKPYHVNIVLTYGQALHITVIRVTDKTDSFTFTYRTASRGKFLITYGFGFAPKVWEPTRYYTREIGKDSFEIKKQAKPGSMEFTFLPSVFFNWLPFENRNKNWSLSVTGGLGANANNFAVLAGVSAMFNQTIGLSVGGTFYNQKRLLGQYNEGDILKTNLTDNQLYETVIGLNGYIAIIFRLSENPFKKASE